MQHPRVAVALVVGASALMLCCGLLATGAPCVPAPALSAGASRLPDLLDGIEPGAPFEFILTPADVNTFLAGYLEAHKRAVLTAVVVTFDENRIEVDLCVRDILFRPISMHITLEVGWAARPPHITCPAWTIGRIKMPGITRDVLARRLNAEWDRLNALWQVEQWALTENSLSVYGIRRH